MRSAFIGRTIEFVIILTIAAGCFLAGLSCAKPPEAKDVAPVVAPVVKGGCVLLRSFVGGKPADLCATAEDLLPLFSELLAQHEANPPPSEPPRPVIAFSVTDTPKRSAPRRHCAQWVYVAGSVDGGRRQDSGEGDASGP